MLAVAGSMHHPDVARALAAEREALIAALQTWAERAQQAGQVRPDWTGRELATWLLALEDAFVSAVATDPAFAPGRAGGAAPRSGRPDAAPVIRLGHVR